MADNNLHYFICFKGEAWTGWMRQQGEELVYRKRTKCAQWQRVMRFAMDSAEEVEAGNVPEGVRFAMVAVDRKVLRHKGKRGDKLGKTTKV